MKLPIVFLCSIVLFLLLISSGCGERILVFYERDINQDDDCKVTLDCKSKELQKIRGVDLYPPKEEEKNDTEAPR